MNNQSENAGGKQGHGLVVIAIISLLIGVGGLGFGIYTVANPPKAEKSNLKVKVENTDGSTTELETDKIKEVSDDGSTITITETPSTPQKYIYLDGYDLGLLIPEDSNLEYLSYQYRRLVGGPAYSSLQIGGVTKKEGAQAAPAFVAQDSDTGVKPLGYIEICRNDLDYAEFDVMFCQGDPVYKNDKVTIYYGGPQAISSDSAEWETETVNAIKAILTNKDNYIEVK